MLGAIVGDIAGSTYENYNCKDFEKIKIFAPGSHLTDDSVLTLATADFCVRNNLKIEQENSSEPWGKFKACSYTQAYLDWGNRYPNAGYGPSFRDWLASSRPQPYGSWGNGSAMRVSPLAWVAAFAGDSDSGLQWVMQEAHKSAQVTHNHPEGIQGAQATAAAIYLARAGKSKEYIRDFLEQKFGYNLRRTLDEIRPRYQFQVSCQKSVPEAILAFLESKNFEDSIRLAISLGGDSDTIACITGSIAHAYYGTIPRWMVEHARGLMDQDQLHVLEQFCSLYQVSGAT